MAQVFKSPLEQVNALAPETTRSKWNRFLKYGMRGGSPKTIDKYNKLLEEVEGEFKFKDQAEHDIWSNWLSDYRGSQDLLDLSDAILSRGEPNYVSDKADDIIRDIYSKERMPGNEYKAWAKARNI